jgi:elongation of very long chain fatty acids protein 7
MMAAIGPEMQKYLWWKKYLTILQMIQFIGIMTHSFQLIFHNPCNYPMAFVYWIGAHAVMFYFLFSNFYKQAYDARKKKITETKPDKNENKKENGKIQSVVQSNGNGFCNGNENGVRNRVYNEIATH